MIVDRMGVIVFRLHLVLKDHLVMVCVMRCVLIEHVDGMAVIVVGMRLELLLRIVLIIYFVLIS